jgi:monoamine oxidase
VDLSDANLNWGQKTAIRGLTYGPATKVAIKFSRPWWITDCGITSAGVASTDELLRTCVYPSYNLHDGADNPAVLLCSYTWEQDALRIGSLVRPDSPNGEDELKEVLFRGLARLHGVTYDMIAPLYMTHHAWNWHQDPNSMGAFAAFGPTEFSTLYPHLPRPAAGGLLHFAGEATSTHHAWIVGALESGYRAVSAFFERFGMWEVKEELRKKFGPDPGELETGDDGTEHLQVWLGSWDGKEREKRVRELFEEWTAGNASRVDGSSIPVTR